MTTAADHFWRFSLRFYALPKVSEACLRLQDEAGLNVNLVLWCCWRALHGDELNPGKVRAAMARIAPWSRTVTVPLRMLRRQMKSGSASGVPAALREALYRRLKAAELEAERAEQALLCCCSPRGTPVPEFERRPLAERNLHAYMTAAGLPPGTPLRTVIPGQLAQRLAAMPHPP